MIKRMVNAGSKAGLRINDPDIATAIEFLNMINLGIKLSVELIPSNIYDLMITIYNEEMKKLEREMKKGG